LIWWIFMSSIKRLARVLAIAAFALMLPVFAGAQDLGSTSGIFSPKSTKKKTTKKKTTKKKSTRKASTKKKKTSSSSSKKSSKRRSTSTAKKRSTTTARKRSNKSSSTSRARRKTPVKTQPVSSKSSSVAPKPEDIVITVGAKSKAEVQELFDDSIATGNAARNRRLYSEAEKAYSAARTLDPTDSRAIYGLGNIFSDQQRWEEAEAAYRRALEIEPENPLANIALSFVLTQPVVGTNLGERFKEADLRAREAIRLDPENAIGYDQLGVAMELRGIISDETEAMYQKAIDLDPTFALAYSHLGRLMRKQGRTNQSSAAYRKAISLSADVPTMILVADVMQSQQRYLDSERLLREALRRDPRNPTGLYLLGRALTTRKSFDEAEEVLKKSVEVSPGSFVSYALLGSLYSQSGDLKRAEKILVEALSVISPNEQKRLAQEFEAVGDGLLKKNRFTDAVRVYRRALALDAEKASLTGKLSVAVSKT